MIFCWRVTYSGSVRPHVRILEPGHAEVVIPDRRANRQHLGSVHAIALLNVAEQASGLALLTDLPDRVRGIVTRISMQYVKKARGPITAIGEPPVPRTSARATYDVPVVMRDESGDEVARAVLHSLVGPKPGQGTDRRDVN